MDLEVVGRHVLLFDDDAMAEFVNSPAALVDWNSLSIDRYDVRHLLSAPPPPRSLRRRQPDPPDDSLESELDRERYLDLVSAPDDLDSEHGGAGSETAGGYNAVPFSYGNPGETTDQKSADAESGFRPPFSVPENLLQHLPPTEKVHQIIARTAAFVSKHGGQSEIVLRVKQGDNPTFGFLMPDHELHPYFRYLVDHQDLMKFGTDGNSADDKGKTYSRPEQAGSLSLLGSIYGSVEDEDAPNEAAPLLVENNEVDAPIADNLDVFGGSDQKRDEVVSKKDAAGPKKDVAAPKKDEAVSNVPGPPLKEKKIRVASTVKALAVAEPKKGCNLFSLNASSENLQYSASSSLPNIEAFVLEPSSDMKRVVDKIVEFILRNGREFEAVLVQQDTKHGRFPFLIPSNPYHPYYLKVLQKAQSVSSKGLSERHDSLGQGGDRKSISNASNIASSATDIPHDPDRKEKFKMVIGKLKKDGQEPASKATQPESGFSVDAAAAAAILQAATKGIKNPNLSLLSKASVSGTSQGHCSGGGGPSCSNSLHSSQSHAIPKPGVSAPVAKVIAKTAAVAAASEADSSEARLTREQKLKAERLKRAKLFAAMIKNGAAPVKDDWLRALSVEPLESGCSGSGAETINVAGREREGSSVLPDADNSKNIGKIDNRESADVQNKRRSKRSYRSRSRRGEEDEEDEDEDAGTEVEGEDETEDRNHKHSRKKRRSHHSSHRSSDRNKRKKRHSYSKDKDSRSRHNKSSTSEDENLKRESLSEDKHGHHRDSKQVSSSDDEQGHSRHRKKHHASSDDEHRHSRHRHGSSSVEVQHSRHKSRYYSSSGDEHFHSRSRHEDGSSSDPKHKHAKHRKKRDKASANEYDQKFSTKRGKKSQSKKEADLEEGEIVARVDKSRGSEGNDNPSRESWVNLSEVGQDVSAAKPQPSESPEVSDDLRAKIRAMLMATL